MSQRTHIQMSYEGYVMAVFRHFARIFIQLVDGLRNTFYYILSIWMDRIDQTQ